MFIECYHKVHKDQKVQGFLDYHSCAELEEVAQYNVYEILEDNQVINTNYTGENEIDYLCIYAHGSRVFGNPRKNSDIDFVLFYKGSIREDDLFNIFVDENIYIEHIKCDFNPIQIDDDSDIEYYIQKHDIKYHQHPLMEKMHNLALALDDYEDNESTNSSLSQHNDVIDSEDVIKYKVDLMKEVVDLGLPSDTLWCKYNLGVNLNQLSKPEDWYGDYYAWGELETKSEFNWNNYKFGKDYNKLTKYCNDSEYGLNNFTDNLIELLPEDDAAYQNKKLHNYKFHIPTKEQFEELLKYTSNYWVNNYNPNKAFHNPEDDAGIKGLNGRVFEGKNGNQLFAPVNGYRSNSTIYGAGSDGGLWTSGFDLDQHDRAYDLYFDSDYIYVSSGNRCIGLAIRPVISIK